MRNEWKKISFKIAMGMVVLGGILFAAGCFLGGRPGLYISEDTVYTAEGGYDRKTRKPLEKKEKQVFVRGKTAVEPFCEFDINLKYADLEIFPADGYYVEYELYDLAEPVCSIEDGILTLLEGERQESGQGSGTYFFWMGNTGLGWEAQQQTSKGYVKLYLPVDSVLKRATVWSDYGDFTAGNLEIENFDINLTFGNVEMDGWQGQRMDMYLRNGAVRVTNGIEAKESCTLASQYGNVEIGSLYAPEGKLTLRNGNLEAGIKDGTQLAAENHYGDVRLRTEGELKECDFDLSTEYGEVKGDYKNLLVALDSAWESGMKVSYKADGEARAALTVTCRNGNVEVNGR